MDKSTVQQIIRNVFANVQYPGDNRLGAPDGRDDGEEVTEWLRGKDWHSLKSNELWPSALYYMTAEAYHYYFPAYLLGAMEENSGDVIDSLLHRLTPPSEADAAVDDFEERYSRFAPAQKKSIVAFLTWELDELIAWQQRTRRTYKSEEKKLTALRDYWEHVINS